VTIADGMMIGAICVIAAMTAAATAVTIGAGGITAVAPMGVMIAVAGGMVASIAARNGVISVACASAAER